MSTRLFIKKNWISLMKINSLWLCVITLIGVILLFELTSLDLYFQDFFYNFQTHQWVIDRNERISKLFFYTGVKKLFIFLLLCLVLSLIFLRKNPVILKYRQGLILVCLSAVVIPLFIGGLKSITNVPCPRDIEHYQGTYPYVRLLDKYPANFHQTKNIKCYPAGHASGAFALLSLYFLFKTTRNRRISLGIVMGLAWSMGNYKMLIGDHFFSHTWVTMNLSWIIILLLKRILESQRFNFNFMPNCEE
ncbi:MAG: phosphoesterase [Gammaproteobacteria bacterium CG22_combo_CG10-13_8_21_14_all_40_8]|nr:MAG: phosphoesterase [Gammaproteobacteria bacterium CG22_combo_CG10-13_8_21_14_all_40_8]